MITAEELKTRIALGEDAYTEFKLARPSSQEVARVTVAFANGREEGWLIIGVAGSLPAEIIGVQDADKLTQYLRNIGRRQVDPPINPVIETVALDGKDVVVMRIEGGQSPFDLLRVLRERLLDLSEPGSVSPRKPVDQFPLGGRRLALPLRPRIKPTSASRSSFAHLRPSAWRRAASVRPSLRDPNILIQRCRNWPGSSSRPNGAAQRPLRNRKCVPPAL